MFHENRCYDWGTFGWAIAEGKVDTAKYRAFVFMNSSVRGPFLPAYFPVSWSLPPSPALHRPKLPSLIFELLLIRIGKCSLAMR